MSNGASKGELAIFESNQYGYVRGKMIDGEAWFVASDVAKALGYIDASDAVRAHCKKVNKITQQGECPVSVNCPPVTILIIPLSDVLRLVMRSNLPKAVDFQDWVVEDVLPSILKTGQYMFGQSAGNINHENIFDRVRPLDMLDAIYQYRQAGETEKAQILAQYWERNFGFKAFDEEQISVDDTPLNIEAPVSASQCPTVTSDESLLSPAKIGTLLSPQLSGKEVNRLLCEMELQKTDHRGYLPTEKGAAYTPGRTPYAVNLRWKMEVIPVIKEYLQDQRTDHSFSL